MTGVILAGGKGSRMRPATELYNKHTIWVYDRPMIDIPIKTLKDMGCDNVQIISSPEGVGDIAKLVKDGAEFEVDITYKIQREADGMAGALGVSNVQDELFPVVCGDCYYDPNPVMPDKPSIWWSEVEFAKNHGVWNPETNEIIEKPIRDIGRRAVIGVYVYDQRVYDVIRQLKPSARGELEITDINNWYLKNGGQVLHHAGFFGDMGTTDGLLRVANHIKENKE
jgi:glucose-1-phosphate thymidylyltransferase